MSGGVVGVYCPGESWGIRPALCESSAYIRHSFFDNYTNCVAELKRDADKSENTWKGIGDRSGNNSPIRSFFCLVVIGNCARLFRGWADMEKQPYLVRYSRSVSVRKCV